MPSEAVNPIVHTRPQVVERQAQASISDGAQLGQSRDNAKSYEALGHFQISCARVVDLLRERNITMSIVISTPTQMG